MTDEIVEINFRGQTHKIRCGMGLLNEYIRVTGQNPFKANWREASTVEMTGFIVAGLRKATGDKSLTIENVEDELSLEDLSIAAQLLTNTLAIIQKKTKLMAEPSTGANGLSPESITI